VTDTHVALHVGELLYGNLGSLRRLDFTVLGPAVNEAARIEAPCGSLEQTVIVSSAFAEAAGEARCHLVSLGRYAMKGVARTQELFTLDPVGGEFAIRRRSGSETGRDNAAARHIDRGQLGRRMTLQRVALAWSRRARDERDGRMYWAMAAFRSVVLAARGRRYPLMQTKGSRRATLRASCA
jgi:hypothetical protein